MNARSVSLAAWSLAVFLSAPAFAQPEERPRPEDPPDKPDRYVPKEKWAKSQGYRIGFEVDFLSRSIPVETPSGPVDDDELAFGFAVVGQFKLYSGLHLDIDVPAGYADVEEALGTESSFGKPAGASGAHSAFVFGNPTIGLHYSANPLSFIALFGGLGVSIPLFTPTDDQSLAAHAVFPARGYYDMNRYLFGYVPLKARVGTELRLFNWLHLRSDIAALLAFKTGDGDDEVIIEQGNEAEIRAKKGFGTGVRFQSAMPLGLPDDVQLAIEPFMSDEPTGAGVYYRLGVFMALDNPLGFGFDHGKVATVRLSMGGKF